MGGKFAANSQTQRLPQPSQPHRVNSTVTLLNESFLGRLQVGHILVFFRQGFHRRETRHHHCVESKIKNKKNNCLHRCLWPKSKYKHLSRTTIQPSLQHKHTHMHKFFETKSFNSHFQWRVLEIFPKDLPPCLSILVHP